jgi:hypothetical protein
MTSLLTRPSTPKLSDLARKVVAPKGVVATAWPRVEQKCHEFGVRFRPWQPDVGRLILAKRADGKYAATIGGTGLSIPRQVGKTFLVGAIVFALCLLFPNLTVIWTAHRLRTAEETFGKMQVFAKRRRIKPHIAKVVLGSGEEEIRFVNGSRILFGARERGFGRGFDEVDVLIFDEAQILSENALDDMIPATNQSRQPSGALLLFMGTPPKPTDPGDVFRRMRNEALTGEDDDTGWIEFGADADFTPTLAPAPLTAADWAQVEKANPSYPEDTPREAILRMRKKLGPESFLREGLGIWDEDGRVGILPGWDGCATEDEPPDPTAIGIAVSLDCEWASIGAAGVRADDRVHVGAVERRRGTAWTVAEAKRIQDERGCEVIIDEKCPDATLPGALEDAGVRVTAAKLSHCFEACSEMVNRVKDKRLTHSHHPDLDDAVAGAAWRWVLDRKLLGRKQSASDVSMLEAVTLAAAWAGASYDPMNSFW